MPGIDMFIEAARDAVRQMCRERHIRISQYGNAYRLKGIGIDRVVTHLEAVTARDLRPMNRKGFIDEQDEADDFYLDEMALAARHQDDEDKTAFFSIETMT